MNSLLLIAFLPLACQDTKVGIYNTAPTATITDPADGIAYDPGDLIELRGLVQDSQEEPAELTVYWTSSLDGEIGTSIADTDGIVSLPVTELTGGTHAVTLTAVDGEGKVGEESITIDVGQADVDEGGDPTLIVLGPIEGEVYTFSQTITVVATATDDEQSWETLNASIISSRDGTLWTGTPASNGAITEDFAGLSTGPHQIAVSVEDADGNVVSESVTVEVTDDGEPDVAIVNPPAESSWWTDETLTFEGVVGDDITEPADLIVEWSSNIDGILMSGYPDSSGYTAFADYLTEGTHVLTLDATDEDFNKSSDSITLTIIDPLNYDNDGDGYSELEEDCDDADPTTYPGASEVCDNYDNNCNGLINEDWWDSYDITTGMDNDTVDTAYDLGEVDAGFLWSGDYLEVAGLSLHESADEDWFKVDIDDDIYDNANFTIRVSNLYAGGTWVVELYDINGGTPQLEDSASGTGSLSVGFNGDWLDDDEDDWAIRVYQASWPGSGICTTLYSLEINA